MKKYQNTNFKNPKKLDKTKADKNAFQIKDFYWYTHYLWSWIKKKPITFTKEFLNIFFTF